MAPMLTLTRQRPARELARALGKVLSRHRQGVLSPEGYPSCRSVCDLARCVRDGRPEGRSRPSTRPRTPCPRDGRRPLLAEAPLDTLVSLRSATQARTASMPQTCPQSCSWWLVAASTRLRSWRGVWVLAQTHTSSRVPLSFYQCISIGDLYLSRKITTRKRKI